jgi:DNA-binding transcriptional LysR family regulator
MQPMMKRSPVLLRHSNPIAPASSYPTQGRLLHFVPEWCASPLPFYLVYPYARYYPARLRLFMETVRAMMSLIEEKTFSVFNSKNKRT